MKAPDKIYYHEGRLGSPFVSRHKETEEDVEYIRKDALLEWVKTRYEGCDSIEDSNALYYLLEFIYLL